MYSSRSSGCSQAARLSSGWVPARAAGVTRQSRQAGACSVNASKPFWCAQLARLPQAGSRSNMARGAARSASWKSAWLRAAPRGTSERITTAPESTREAAQAPAAPAWAREAGRVLRSIIRWSGGRGSPF